MTYDLEGWKAIAHVLGVSEKTARIWARTAGKESPVWVWRRRVRARSAELRAWFEAQHRPFE